MRYDSHMKNLKWLIFAIVVVGLFGGIIWLSKSDEKPFTGDASKIITDGPIADHVSGTDSQKIVLIEYGDYQCPGCGAMYQPVKALTEKYKNKLTFIFRNMPLTNLHPNALAAATAAEAAGLQGKYYEMHDVLYGMQQAWSDAKVDQRGAVFESYASQLGLDLSKYHQDLSSSDIITKINRDKTTGLKSFGVDSTPTFILNGEVIKGPDAVNIDVLTSKVEAALKAD